MSEPIHYSEILRAGIERKVTPDSGPISSCLDEVAADTVLPLKKPSDA